MEHDEYMERQKKMAQEEYMERQKKMAFSPMGPETTFGFSHALDAVRSGSEVARRGWLDKNMALSLDTNATYGSHQKPRRMLLLRVQSGESPWVPSQEDMLQDDWYLTGRRAFLGRFTERDAEQSGGARVCFGAVCR